MHTKSHNSETMMGSITVKIIQELFGCLLQNYLKDFEEPMTGSEFKFDSINLLYYHLQKISLKTGGSYIASPEWLKNRKATIYPKYIDNNCYQYALTVVLNHKQIKSHP